MQLQKSNFSPSFYLCAPASGLITYYSLKDLSLEMRVIASATVTIGTLGIIFLLQPSSPVIDPHSPVTYLLQPPSQSGSTITLYDDSPVSKSSCNSLDVSHSSSPRPVTPPPPPLPYLSIDERSDGQSLDPLHFDNSLSPLSQNPSNINLTRIEKNPAV